MRCDATVLLEQPSLILTDRLDIRTISVLAQRTEGWLAVDYGRDMALYGLRSHGGAVRGERSEQTGISSRNKSEA